MRRFKLPLLAVFPAVVLFLVLAVPLTVGSYPLRWRTDSLVPRLVVSPDRHGYRPPYPPTTATGKGGGPILPRVAVPWRPGMAQWGVQLYWEDNGDPSSAYLTRQAQTLARYLIGLNANSVAISFPFFTGTITSDTIKAGPATPSPQHLAEALKVFEKAGLRTTIRPIMDEKSLGALPNWRGSIAPAHPRLWFAHYEKFLIPYLNVAQQYHAATFTIATEFNSLQGDPRWKRVVAMAARHFSGEISYDANWGAYVTAPVLMPVRHLGVDAYFPLQLPDSAPVRKLVQGWNDWLDKVSSGPLPGIVLSEAGIAAMNGAYHAPGDWYVKRPLNPQVQARWYTAVCDVVRQRHMAGVYWWSIPFNDNPFQPPGPASSRLDFAGRPLSVRAIRACFTSGYTPPAAPTPPS